MQPIHTKNAPEAVGPYSQAIKCGDMIFCSGQIPLTADGKMVRSSVEDQTEQVLKNLTAVLNKAGSSLEKVVKTTIYLTQMDDFKRVNEVYEKYFVKNKPARATVAVAALPLDARIEIECIASI